MGFRTYTCKIARNCGGCEWLSVPYPIQLRRKQEQVESLLGDMAASCGARIDKICGVAGEPLAYRHKAATPFAPAGHGRIRCGFYAAGTHRIIPCEKCLVEDPRARKILNGVARVAERLHIPAYEEDRGIGVLRHAVVREVRRGDSRRSPRGHEHRPERQHAQDQRHPRQAEPDPVGHRHHARQAAWLQL